MFNIRVYLLFFSLFAFYAAQAMVYDNRYWPLYDRFPRRTLCKQSSFFADVMIMTARNASLDADDTVTIPRIFGDFDQRDLARAIIALGEPNPIPNIPGDLPWKIRGKIQAEGLAFQWNQHLYGYFSCGMSWFFMHVMSRHLFRPIGATAQHNQQTVEMLDDTLRDMFETIGITSTKWSKTGMSDTDIYFRVGNVWDYPYKFRRIDAGIRLGVMIPTGVEREVDNPASIPFGGDGHWGIYMAGDAEFEIRQDWSLGLLLRLSQRFDKTKIRRLQVSQEKREQQLYAAIVGPVEREEGLTAVFAPYLRIEDLREGLGFLVGYTIVNHDDDRFMDKRAEKVPFSSIGQLNLKSGWAQEYMTINVYYDFAKVKQTDSFKPTVSLMWDFPVQYFVADRVPKTNRILFGIEFDF